LRERWGPSTRRAPILPNIPRYTVGFLQSRGLVLATAESCTAGLIASMLAEVPGSGGCLDVGFVVYSPSGKSGFLGVSKTTIDRFGLTSEEVAREMVQGALAQPACRANVAVANTGLADGPSDGSRLTPGTQCFAWAYRHRTGLCVFSETVVFPGRRNEVRRAAALYALEQISHYLDRIPACRPVRA
jgi:nicotinamide-nucleotide amidase